MSSEEMRRVSERALEKIENWDRPLIIQTDIMTVVGLTMLVQLALRHPEAKTMETARLAKDLIANLIEQIDPAHGDIWRFLNAGFNPVHDV